MRFSVKMAEVRPILNWPLSFVTCKEVTPPQFRFQWGRQTEGARLDSYSGLRLNLLDEKLTLDYGARSTNAQGPLSKVETQRVGVASLTINGKYQVQSWNDLCKWWWPIGDCGDQGDTAGVSMSYALGKTGFPVRDGWSWNAVRLSLRLATGIPDRASAVTVQNSTVYTLVEFEDIDRGDINLNTLFTNVNQQRLDVGVTVNSGAVRNLFQSKLVHKTLGIPEFPLTNHLEFMIYLRLQNF
jgi:hypothetical protein